VILKKKVCAAGCAKLNIPKYDNYCTKVESYMRMKSDL
jgi:hypothetical protein